jgi:DNA replication protein DnaC
LLTLFGTKDGTIYGLLGGGYATSGVSLAAMVYADRVMNMAWNLEDWHKQHADDARDLIKAKLGQTLDELQLELRIFETDMEMQIVEKLVELIHTRVLDELKRLKLGYVVDRLDVLLNDAARTSPTYLDFLDQLLREELGSKQRKRVQMGISIAHFPTVKTLDDFDFKFQPSIDQKLVRELATGRFIASAENALLFGPPGVGKTHLAIALGRAAVEAGYSVLFVTTAALLADLLDSHTKGNLSDRLLFYSKPKLLIIDELGYLPFERQAAHLFFQLVARRYEKGSMIITTNQQVMHWGAVFGDDVVAAALLDRLLHHSHTLFIQGESYRLKQKKKAGLRVQAAAVNS